ncbi:MAG: AAA family ATPase [Actinobacteria bacterium]|nr:AAA family ATPase [Actinomycetota bacterium]
MRVARGELIERESELALIEARIGGIGDGHETFLAIQGEAGIGKTSLFKAARRWAAAQGLRVLSARGSDLESEFAFGVVRQALEPAVAGRKELFAGGAALAAAAIGGAGAIKPSVSEGMLHGLYWLVAELADQAPLLLAVDDLHWADAESLAFLRFLAVRLESMRVGVVVATRPPAEGSPVARLLADVAVETLAVGALGPEGAARLLAGRLGTTPHPQFSAAAHAASGGNPFLLDQLAQALLAEGIAPVADQAPRIATLQPDGLARAVVARLDADARALARAVAILGDDAPVALAAELASLPPHAAECAADALEHAGVLADVRPLRFRHALLRGAVLGSMRAGEQAGGHAAAIDLLGARGADPERLAAHLLRIEPRGEPRDALSLLAAADRAARRGAHTSAALVLVRALAEPLDRAQRHRALLALGESEWALGRGSAADHFIAAAGLAGDDAERRAAAIRAGHAAALDAARVEPALALLARVQAPAGDREAAMQLVNARLAAVWADFDRHRANALEAAALGPEGATATESMVLAHLARDALQNGEPADVVTRLLDGALRHEALERTTWFVPVMIGLAAVDRHEEADALAQRVIEHARAGGRLSSFALANGWRGRVAWMRGDLVRAEERALAATEAAIGAQWWTLIGIAVLVESLVDQGRVADAAAAWANAGLGDDVPRHRALHQLLHARSRIREARGDAAGALEDLRELDCRVGEHAKRSVNWLATRLRTAELLHATGAVDEALADARAAVELAKRFGAGSAAGSALRVHGWLAQDAGELMRAIEALAASPARLEHARALIDLGALLRRRGARSDAREPLLGGHELALACGATPDVERARSELAATGLHVERLPAAGGDELTASERRIAALAADGATNKEIAQALFVTIKTVEMHLSAVYRKLGIRSRRDLPRALGST